MPSQMQHDESARGNFSKVTETPVSIVLIRFCYLHFCWFPCKTTPSALAQHRMHKAASKVVHYTIFIYFYFFCTIVLC